MQQNPAAMASAGVAAALNSSAALARNTTLGTNATALALEDDEDRVDPAVAILLLYAFLVGAQGRWRAGWTLPRALTRALTPAQLLIIGAQAGLFYWKQKHKRSYELVSGGRPGGGQRPLIDQ
jgi:hypothetical protein